MADQVTAKIKIGISSCLLGNPVRYNGGHQHDRFITNTLGRYFEFLPVCPEVECGLGIPRETMRLVGDPHHPRLLTSKTRIDHTDTMLVWAQAKVRDLSNEGLHGFIFKSKSPSSGMTRIKVYGDNHSLSTNGVGLFAREFMEHFPLLPVEDDGRLHDPAIRENFIERIFAYKRWRDVIAAYKTKGGLVTFHTSHKLQVLAHSESHYRAMGQLAAHGKEKSLPELFAEYERLLMEALRVRTTNKKNANVLQHMLGYFKKMLSSDEKQEMLEVIEHYKNGIVPLIVPITLVNHYVRKYDQEYLRGQYYLHPHPLELKLRNHV